LLKRPPRLRAWRTSALVLQSQFGTLPLVMAATSGGLMTASPH
jgi:hypothetical protein